MSLSRRMFPLAQHFQSLQSGQHFLSHLWGQHFLSRLSRHRDFRPDQSLQSPQMNQDQLHLLGLLRLLGQQHQQRLLRLLRRMSLQHRELPVLQ
jgi:hypothetical protein